MIHESLPTSIDRLRQRHLTDEELTGVASTSVRMKNGCLIVEALRSMETDIVDAVAARVATDAAALESKVPGTAAALRDIATLVLRQAALAQAADSPQAYYDALNEALLVLLELHLPQDVARNFGHAVVEEAGRRIAVAGHQAYTELLLVAAEYIVLVSTVSAHRAEILRDTVTRTLSRFPDLAKQGQGATNTIVADAERLLTVSLRACLPDGASRMHTALRARLDVMLRQPKLAVVEAALAEELLESAQRQMKTSSRHTLLPQMTLVRDFLGLAAEANAQGSALVTKAVERACTRQSKRSTSPKAKEELTSLLAGCLLDIVLGTLPGGLDIFLSAMNDRFLAFRRVEASEVVSSDAIRILVEGIRSSWSGRSLGLLMPTLENAMNFLLIAADLGAKQQTMLEKVTDALGERHADYYKRHPITRDYVIRDQDQLLLNAAMSYLHGSWKLTVGRFCAFGEYVIKAKFTLEMMMQSFELLEEAVRNTLSRHTVAFLLPRLRGVRRYLEACANLAFHEEKILEAAVQPIIASYSAEIDRFPAGRAKVERDLKTLLHTAMATALPNGEEVLVRGLGLFYDAIVAGRMDQTMMDAAYKGLTKAVSAHLPRPYAAWIVPVLEKTVAMGHAASGLGGRVDTLVEEAVVSACGSLNGTARHLGAQLRDLVRAATLSVVPGGDRTLARCVATMAHTAQAEGWSTTVIDGALGTLRRSIGKACDRATSSALATPLENAAVTLGLVLDASDVADNLVARVLDEVVRRNADVVAKIPRFVERRAPELRRLLLVAVLATTPGGEQLLAHHLQACGEVVRHQKLSGQYLHDELDALQRAVMQDLKSSGRKVLGRLLEAVRDSLALTGGLGDHEDVILRESFEKLLAKRAQQLSEHDTKELALHGARMLLRASALAVLPGGDSQRAEAVGILSAMANSRILDASVIGEAGGFLQESCRRHLQAGPVKAYAATVQKSASTLAA